MNFIKIPENVDFEQDVQTEEDLRNFEKDQMNFAINQSNLDAKIPSRFATNMFGDFPERIVNIKGRNVNVTATVKKFSITKQNDRILLVSGPAGTGKTTLMAAGVHERAINGMASGLYLTSRLLCPMLRTSRSFTAKESEMDLYDKYSKVPFLCWDEVGDCEDELIERNFLRTILSARYDNLLPTWINTNLNFDQFKNFIRGNNQTIKDPIIDRLNALIVPLVLDGNSNRLNEGDIYAYVN